MELDAVKRLALDCAGKGLTVDGPAEDVLLRSRNRRERVDEVERRLVGELRHKARLLRPAYGVPADVRNLQSRRWETVDPALEQAEPPRALVLARSLEQELEPEADAERRNAGRETVADEHVELELAKVVHCLREGAHAGQD